jgi:hypothetical protein
MPQPRSQPGSVPMSAPTSEISGVGSRRRHRAAVLGGFTPARSSTGRPPLRSISGTVLDASPHLLVLHTPRDGERRLPMSGSTVIWYGGRAGPHVLQPGRHAIVRPTPDGLVADRIWVDIVRVTGTIIACDKETVEVDAGPHRGRLHVLIPPGSLGRVLVRHPRFEPGYLIDVIAVRSPGGPLAVRPGTSQPANHADHIAPPKVTGPLPDTLQGSATWFDQDGRGAAYPALDAEGQAGGCPDAPVSSAGLPYLSRGSDLLVRNACADRSAIVPVVECGCVAARYCDRCVECGASPRGRIVELTATSFVDLGGDLDVGCFNAVVTVRG